MLTETGSAGVSTGSKAPSSSPPPSSQAQALASPPSSEKPQPLTSPSSPSILVGATRVYGLPIDAQTRCVHWAGPVDVVALSHPCCGRFYPCAECHDAVADHARKTWPAEGEEEVALCGSCGTLMTAREYMQAKGCGGCGHGFNPRCALHRDRYFA